MFWKQLEELTADMGCSKAAEAGGLEETFDFEGGMC